MHAPTCSSRVVTPAATPCRESARSCRAPAMQYPFHLRGRRSAITSPRGGIVMTSLVLSDSRIAQSSLCSAGTDPLPWAETWSKAVSPWQLEKKRFSTAWDTDIFVECPVYAATVGRSPSRVVGGLDGFLPTRLTALPKLKPEAVSTESNQRQSSRSQQAIRGITSQQAITRDRETIPQAPLTCVRVACREGKPSFASVCICDSPKFHLDDPY